MGMALILSPRSYSVNGVSVYLIGLSELYNRSGGVRSIMQSTKEVLPRCRCLTRAVFSTGLPLSIKSAKNSLEYVISGSYCSRCSNLFFLTGSMMGLVRGSVSSSEIIVNIQAIHLHCSDTILIILNRTGGTYLLNALSYCHSLFRFAQEHFPYPLACMVHGCGIFHLLLHLTLANTVINLLYLNFNYKF